MINLNTMCFDPIQAKRRPHQRCHSQGAEAWLVCGIFCLVWFAFGYFGIVLSCFGCYVSAGWLRSDFQGEKKQQLLLLELQEVELLMQLQAKKKQQQQKQETKPFVLAYCLPLSFVAATE